MKTELVQVSPAKAREWLKANTNNRPVRRDRVEAMRQAWDRGEWKVTHQGIAFGRDGVLKDGQHRLLFISELPDNARVPILVTNGLDNDAFGVIDVGVRRNAADELHIGPGKAAVANTVATIYNGNQKFGITTPYLVPFVEFVSGHYDRLIAFCGTTRPIWSSAPVRAAAIIQMARGHNFDFVCSIYRSLVMRDAESMTPAARSLFNQVLDGKAGGARSTDLFVRALRVFDSKAPSTSKITIKSPGEVTADVRRFLEAVIDAPRLKKKAPQSRA